MSEKGRAADINEIYTERNIAVGMAVSMAVKLGYAINNHVDPDEPDWVVVFIGLPTGQVSWHIPRNEYSQYFPDYIPVAGRNPWDGHTTDEKNERIARFAWGIFDEK